MAADLDCPLHHTADFGDVPILDAVAVAGDDGSLVVQLGNRSVGEPVDLRIGAGVGPSRFRAEGRLLHDGDTDAANTLSDPERIALRELDAAWDGTEVHLTLPPVSWAQVSLIPVAD